jgi:serine protease Do
VIAGIPVGETVKIKVIRDRKPMQFRVKIAKREDTRLMSRSEPEQRKEEFGIRVTTLTDEIAQRFNIPETSGVIVSDVERGSAGDNAGVQIGDIIKEINHEVIESVAGYTAAIKRADPDKPINLFVWRKNAGFLVLKLER